MNIYQGFESVEKIPRPILTIGTFDGVHVGHQKIIRQLNAEAEKSGGESVIFTFYPHPRMVISPDKQGLKLIQTQNEKIEKLKRIGLKNLIIHPFTLEFSKLSAYEFVKIFLVEKLNVHTVIVGYDHQFGNHREGNLAFLQEQSKHYDFNVIEIPAHEIDDVNISSTKIRKALSSGDVKTASIYLNENFQLSGTVIHGEEIGRKIGFPTANIKTEDELKIIPITGVYAVDVVLENGKQFRGMMNIGSRPTVSLKENIQLEVFIFDFSGDIYGQKITVSFLDRIREEKKFASINDLKQQLQQDEKIIRHIFAVSDC